jgi:hypothetical protein
VSDFVDWTEVGIWPLQHHDPTFTVEGRRMMAAGRVGPAEGANLTPSSQTYGDIQGGMLWKESGGKRKFLHSWFLTGPGVINMGQGGAERPGETVTRDQVPKGGWLPIRGAGGTPDDRYEFKSPALPGAFKGKLPKNHTGIVTVGTEEFSQLETLHPDWLNSLVAVNAAGDPIMGTYVCDLNADNTHGASAPLQRVFTVIDGAIGLQWGRGGRIDGGPTNGYGLVVDWDRDEGAYMSNHKLGPLTTGGQFCRHGAAAKLGAMTVKPGHITCDAFFVNAFGDGPLNFEPAPYPTNALDLPQPTHAHLKWDNGKWKVHASCAFFIPDPDPDEDIEEDDDDEEEGGTKPRPPKGPKTGEGGATPGGVRGGGGLVGSPLGGRGGVGGTGPVGGGGGPPPPAPGGGSESGGSGPDGATDYTGDGLNLTGSGTGLAPGAGGASIGIGSGGTQYGPGAGLGPPLSPYGPPLLGPNGLGGPITPPPAGPIPFGYPIGGTGETVSTPPQPPVTTGGQPTIGDGSKPTTPTSTSCIAVPNVYFKAAAWAIGQANIPGSRYVTPEQRQDFVNAPITGHIQGFGSGNGQWNSFNNYSWNTPDTQPMSAGGLVVLPPDVELYEVANGTATTQSPTTLTAPPGLSTIGLATPDFTTGGLKSGVELEGSDDGELNASVYNSSGTVTSTTDLMTGGVSGFGGDGSLGALTQTTGTYTDASGIRNYTSVTLSGDSTLAATAQRGLTVLATGDVTLNDTSAIHADGRGIGTPLTGRSGSAGAVGQAPSSVAATTDTEAPFGGSVSASGGSGGGGSGGNQGASGFNSAAGGSGKAGNNRAASPKSDGAGAGTGGTSGAAVGDDTAGNNGTDGSDATAIATATRNALTDGDLSYVRGSFLSGGMGARGAGGGGAVKAGAAASGGSGVLGGSAASVSGAGLGHGGNGTNNSNTTNGAGGGGGGGAPGMGGGSLYVEVAGTLTMAAGARISANGGNGGNGGNGASATDAGGGGGAGAGGGSGGFVLVKYAAGSDPSAKVTATAGTGGTGGAGGTSTKGGGNGGAGGDGEAGYAKAIKVAP